MRLAVHRDDQIDPGCGGGVDFTEISVSRQYFSTLPSNIGKSSDVCQHSNVSFTACERAATPDRLQLPFVVQRLRNLHCDHQHAARRLGIRRIARGLIRSAGKISDEVSRNGGKAAYEAGAAASPAVLHEAIYAAIYTLPRGELRRELIGLLRHAKPAYGHRPKGSELRGNLVGMTNIQDRPEEIEGRLVPGHWEGNLIIGTLVERTRRFVVLVHMPTRKADVAASAFAGAPNGIPGSLSKPRPGQGDGGPRWPGAGSTSPTRTLAASTVRTRTRTGCCASTSRKESPCRGSIRPTSMPSPAA